MIRRSIKRVVSNRDGIAPEESIAEQQVSAHAVSAHAMAMQRQGVTLVEAILVIIILVMAATTGMIQFGSGFTMRQSVEIETTHLSKTLRNVRNTAIMNQTTIRVRRFRTRDGDGIEIHELAGPLRDPQDKLGGNPTFAPLQPDLRLSGTSGWVDFRPDGTLNQELQISISSGSIRGGVSVAPVNGAITTDLPSRS